MSKLKPLSSNMEDYMEAIYHIVSEKKAARAKDIAIRMAVNSASVTGALRLLAEKGLINYAPYDVITLTPEGEILARDVVRRHEILKDFFTKVLGVDEEEAEDNACKMEHAISPVIIDRIVRFVEFVQFCPRGGESWINGFHQFCDQNTISGCETAISQCLDNMKERQKQFKEIKQETVTLDTLRSGQLARLIRIKGKGPLVEKLKSLDITPGSIIELEDFSENDDYVGIKVRGYHLSLRKDDFSKMELAPVPSC
ncbi:metal-dependent transcriptional regulator [Desulfosarcina sp. OttesenSCG-928-A07]|nr:metal-dependent transcriptional regulator [Desulfosarcina sp. OttesenSCG-928-G17]MDL2330045.1 metal-dependent transcriptional regulator [Desulfosarcina sp. OttesenSCG-928-A07]